MEKPQGVPSNTEENPREQVQVVTLQSEKKLEKGEKNEEHTKEQESQDLEIKEEDHGLSMKKKGNYSTLKLKSFEIPIPFSKIFLMTILVQQSTKFLKRFKKFYINIHLFDVISLMPNYNKVLKEIIAKKKRLAEFKTH